MTRKGAVRRDIRKVVQGAVRVSTLSYACICVYVYEERRK